MFNCREHANLHSVISTFSGQFHVKGGRIVTSGHHYGNDLELLGYSNGAEHGGRVTGPADHCTVDPKQGGRVDVEAKLTWGKGSRSQKYMSVQRSCIIYVMSSEDQQFASY